MEDNNESKGSINVGTSGLNMDNSVAQIKPGQYSYALNANIENFDANGVSIQNEQGNEFCLQFPDGYTLIGNYFINELNKHVFFLTVPNDRTKSEIGYMDNNDCQYHTLVNASCLNFDINYPIHKATHKKTNCTTEIYWTDGFNPRRYLDINNIPYKLTDNSTLCDPHDSEQLDCNQIKVQPNYSIPEIDLVKIQSGGDLIEGTYQFAAQYGDAVGNPFTSFHSITNPCPIADLQIPSVNFNRPVGKSIELKISNLDVTGQYQYVNIAVIKTINNIASYELVGTYFIERDTLEVIYSGQNDTNVRLAAGDIFEKFPYYEVAQDLTNVQDILVWDNLTSISRINYQEIASKIQLQWESYRIPADETYADELNATNLRGYLRDEVYTFEFVPLLANGKQCDGFHIPGREISSFELNQPNILETNADFIGDVETGTDYAPYWRIYNTASVSGTNFQYNNDPSYKGPYQYGEFAYWESTEEYPCNNELWGDLAGTKIRHHKFPDVLVSPITESPVFDNQDNMVMQDVAKFALGVKINVRQVQQLIQNSSLTQEQKDEIIGFKIVRGDRSTNKSIIGKGILRNVNKYKRDDKEYFFPNYPYNDLSTDPTINELNNAWLDQCKSFNVSLTQLNTTGSDGAYAELHYLDCNTGKLKIDKKTNTGNYAICAISKPTIVGGVGTVGFSDYDVWKIGSFGFMTRGWRCQWEDPIIGTNTAWCEGWGTIGTNCMDSPPDYSGCRSYTIHVVAGTVPVKIGGRGEATIEKLYEVRNTGAVCNIAYPLKGLDSGIDSALNYKQIFNSPETSFGQPFLGDTLKLENVMFGAGKLHFTEVRKNAKYRLLTEEAQRDALDSSRELGDITSPFNAGAMFAAYQAYLTIYINGITRKNYARSINSIANYDYNVSIPNNKGIKQRKISFKKYLIPGVISIGEDSPINNYQRESSVYIKTNEDITALPLPNKTKNLLNNGNSIITEKSRYSISEAKTCNEPGKDVPIKVVSYYASLKNTFLNQWGQIYSYKTVDTGFQCLFNIPQEEEQIIFGGDTFVGRWSFKTKLPYFIDNRVGANDDSDIFYDEIGNIGYPNYWHSSRSVLKDYVKDMGGVAKLTNIVSYKAHHFDCPNNQNVGTDNPNRTFYDGYYYLFNYGQPNFYCESSYNLDLRQAFNNKEGDFWPHVSTSIPDDWVQESFVSIQNDNTYNYNVTFSKQNKENNFSNLPADWDPSSCYTNYPFRAIYSDLQSTDADNRVNNWLIYRAVSYFDFPQNYGKLTSLDGIQNRAVLARFENKSLLYNSLLTIDTSNPQAAYIGNDKFFKQSPPIDFAETDLGYVGCQNKFMLKVPQGQVYADAKRGQLFLITGQEAADLTAFGFGVNRFFTDHLAFEILRYFPNVNTDNHFSQCGMHGVYDSKFDRIIITKLDYIPLDKNIKYDDVLKEFYIEENRHNIIFRTQVYLQDPDYFCNKSWTLSFNFNTKSWISFHSYIPNYYIAENNFFYSGTNSCCGDVEFIAGELIESPITTTTTTTFPPYTTTSTTTKLIDCKLSGNGVIADCTLYAIGNIIEPSPCTRPLNLTSYSLITGYTDETGNIVNSTNSQIDACNAMSYFNSFDDGDPTLNLSLISGSSLNLNIGYTMYSNNTSLIDCSIISDGWYFTDESSIDNTIYQIVNGVITQIIICV